MTDRPQRYQRQESDTPETDIRDRRQPQRHMRPTPEVNTDTNDRGRRQRHWRQTDRHQRYQRQASDTRETDIRDRLQTQRQERRTPEAHISGAKDIR